MAASDTALIFNSIQNHSCYILSDLESSSQQVAKNQHIFMSLHRYSSYILGNFNLGLAVSAEQNKIEGFKCFSVTRV